ncbi:J domain-containing protein [Undibacterium sp. TJN19]|uniref:J domain-containing protein n=1 Tax=Undibacterium sp. TJN19 TaxID=3413055 RepID=UPI003BF05F3E
MITAYPLTWPTGWPRTQPSSQKEGRFGTRKVRSGSSYARSEDITVADAVSRVLAELERMCIHRDDIVISTNIKLRLDGLPRGNEREPNDNGAAVYWETRAGARRVMAIDQYTSVANNLAAIAATLEAMRAIERHGGAQILDRAFTGFTALPAPSTKRTWRDVFQFAPGAAIDPVTLKNQFRSLARQCHPDMGGTDQSMAELNVAYEEAKKELGI